MSDYRANIGDRVRFTAEASRAFGVKADRRRRFTVTGIRSYVGFRQRDIVLSDGSVWSEAWLEGVA